MENNSREEKQQTSPHQSKIAVTDKNSSTSRIHKNAESKKNVLFVCSEVLPFVGTGGLGDVAGSLPKAVNKKNAQTEVRVVLPLYEGMNCDYLQKLEFMFSVNVAVSWRNQYCGVYKLEHDGVVFYFLDNEYYFKRHNIYGYYDDGERFTFFSRSVLEIIPRLGWSVDVLHCHDWHAALVPIYYKLFYKELDEYKNIKTIFTIHNIEYQGRFGSGIAEDVFGILPSMYSIVDFDGEINLMKGAIECSDIVTTVSPSYAEELCDSYCAHGLDGIIRGNALKMKGILNGIDTDLYNPETNKALFENYNVSCLEKKAKNKTELQKMVGLPESKDIPLVAIVSRLAPHKGLDLVKFALHHILMHDVQLVILGTGMTSLEEYFSHIQVEFSKKISTVIAYNKDLSQKIYAGADIFLMPSKSEPCGLSQMIAARYGAIPVVRATGGLKDTIKDCNEKSGNGFVFHDFDVLALTSSIDRAVKMYKQDKQRWNELMLTAMTCDFSWDKSADEYVRLYND